MASATLQRGTTRSRPEFAVDGNLAYNTGMKICCWNVRRATATSGAWGILDEISPDLALLQEVGALPQFLSDKYRVKMTPAVKKDGTPQKFHTAILVRGEIGGSIPLKTPWEWVNRELEFFAGNIVACHVKVNGTPLRAMSVHSPAWPLGSERIHGVDVSVLKLKGNPKLWVTEIIWAALHDHSSSSEIPYVVGGDLNVSETFDLTWGSGNKEVLDRMNDLGFIECLRHWKGALEPTFRNPRDGKVIHQIDHLFVSPSLKENLTACHTYEPERIFKQSLSDHLPIIAEFEGI